MFWRALIPAWLFSVFIAAPVMAAPGAPVGELAGASGGYLPVTGRAVIACPKADPPTYELTQDFVPVKVINNTAPDALRSLYNKHNQSALSGNQEVGGLHYGQLQLRSSLNMLTASDPAVPMACLALKQLNLTLRYEPVIYISRNKAPGSCAYKAALEHEYKHLEADYAVLRTYIPRIRSAAQVALNRLGGMRQMRLSELERGQDAMTAEISRMIDDMVAGIQRDRDRRQALIDTPQEYQRVAALCPR
jgi:hypothetical protein